MVKAKSWVTIIMVRDLECKRYQLYDWGGGKRSPVLEALGSRRCNEVYDRGKGEDRGGVEMGRVRMSVWERVKYSFVDGIDF